MRQALPSPPFSPTIRSTSTMRMKKRATGYILSTRAMAYTPEDTKISTDRNEEHGVECEEDERVRVARTGCILTGCTGFTVDLFVDKITGRKTDTVGKKCMRWCKNSISSIQRCPSPLLSLPSSHQNSVMVQQRTREMLRHIGLRWMSAKRPPTSSFF